MSPPTIAPTTRMMPRPLPNPPPCWPSDINRKATNQNSISAATIATIAPVMTPTRTSFALHIMQKRFASTAHFSSPCA
jgi:hypothetical protein